MPCFWKGNKVSCRLEGRRSRVFFLYNYLTLCSVDKISLFFDILVEFGYKEGYRLDFKGLKILLEFLVNQ
jgi:hypothetical protein